jgi:hypothetical protein
VLEKKEDCRLIEKGLYKWFDELQRWQPIEVPACLELIHFMAARRGKPTSSVRLYESHGRSLGLYGTDSIGHASAPDLN